MPFRWPVSLCPECCCRCDCGAESYLLTVADSAYATGVPDGETWCPCLNGSYLLERSTNPTDPPCTWTLCEQWTGLEAFPNGNEMCNGSINSGECGDISGQSYWAQRTWTLQLASGVGISHNLYQWSLRVDQEYWQSAPGCVQPWSEYRMQAAANQFTSSPQTSSPLCGGTSTWNTVVPGGSVLTVNSDCTWGEGNFTCTMPHFTIAPA